MIIIMVGILAWMLTHSVWWTIGLVLLAMILDD